MSKKIRHIFGLLVLVAMLSACSKDTELYTPQNALQQEKDAPSALPIDPNGSTESGGTGGGGSTVNSGSNKPNPTTVLGNGNISISDDDDDEDDDN